LRRRPDVVPLDHLVERRRLDVQQLGGALLHAAGRLERRLDQALLEVGDDLRNEMPSGGTTNCGIWKRRLPRT
jgi:hypothetical protein